LVWGEGCGVGAEGVNSCYAGCAWWLLVECEEFGEAELTYREQWEELVGIGGCCRECRAGRARLGGRGRGLPRCRVWLLGLGGSEQQWVL
jgi:hypothetical protein